MMRQAIAAGFAAWGASHAPLLAQQPDVLKPFTAEEGVPVRRAIPVERATPVPKAAPVPPIPVPAAGDKPPVEKPALPKPVVKPFKVAPPVVPEIPDPTGEIRLAPSGTTMSADQIQISIAEIGRAHV